MSLVWGLFFDSMYKWDWTIFVFLWFISFSIMSSSFIHVVENAKISFFTVAEIHCMYCVCVCVYIHTTFLYPFIHQWTSRLFPYPDYCKQCCSEHGVQIPFWVSIFISFPLIKYLEVDLLDQRPQTSCHTKLQQHVLVPLPCAFTLVQAHSAGPSPPILDGDTASQTERWSDPAMVTQSVNGGSGIPSFGTGVPTQDS